MLYHASQIEKIDILEPRVSNHGASRVYFSRKRENVLVYLSNAIEKFCKETGFEYTGRWQKWGPYGFNSNGVLRLEEYYPNAIIDTYKDVSAYIYSVVESANMEELPGIPDAVVSSVPVRVKTSEYISDAYEEIMRAFLVGKIDILRYEDLTPKMIEWNERTIQTEYQNAAEHPEYRYFLKSKFHSLR